MDINSAYMKFMGALRLKKILKASSFASSMVFDLETKIEHYCSVIAANNESVEAMNTLELIGKLEAKHFAEIILSEMSNHIYDVLLDSGDRISNSDQDFWREQFGYHGEESEWHIATDRAANYLIHELEQSSGQAMGIIIDQAGPHLDWLKSASQRDYSLL